MKPKMVITGGAGFIGSNAAEYFLNKGYEVEIFDNLSRKNVDKNIDWLFAENKNASNLKLTVGDVRYDQKLLDNIMSKADYVLHLAAQVAVTTSVKDPREDFEINAHGTFNVLEAIRKSEKKPAIIYSSTNKVYGGMEDIIIVEKNGKYCYRDLPNGIKENRLLDFHSPYGCSKGSADQYVRDYSRIYGLNSVVFRQSCIYGQRQFGLEDQGWVAWFIIASIMNKSITVYGDGKQVRDVLHVNDLVKAYDSALENMDKCSGKVYNIGGGPNNQMSILELISSLEKFFDKEIEYKISDWRPGDQPVYVSDIEKAKKELNWEPKIGMREGIDKLSRWVKDNKSLFEDI